LRLSNWGLLSTVPISAQCLKGQEWQLALGLPKVVRGTINHMTAMGLVSTLALTLWKRNTI
jgi:hypothetical protein